MKNIVLLGAGQMGRAARGLLNANRLRLTAIGDNNPKVWDRQAVPPILPVEEAVRTGTDLVLIAVLDEERCGQLTRQLRELGYEGPVLRLSDLYESFDLRAAVLRRMAARVEERNVEGAIAELGAFQGDFAWQLNALFPRRKLYLFDTFEGFDPRDIAVERQVSASRAAARDFSDTSVERVLERMPHREKVVVRKGFFPETAEGLEEVFALVSMDVDLYAPTLAGLEWFYPRLACGGVILLHDYNSTQFDGVRKAVEEYEKRWGFLPLVPLNDLHGTALVIKP